MPEQLLTPEQYAEATGMHIESVRRACREGSIRAVKVGGGRLWRIPARVLSEPTEPKAETRTAA